MATLLIPEATEFPSQSDVSEATPRSKRTKLLLSDPAPTRSFEGSDALPAPQPSEHSAAAASIAPAPLVRITGGADGVGSGDPDRG